METLLQEIMETGSEFAILDIKRVPVVDTLVAHSTFIKNCRRHPFNGY